MTSAFHIVQNVSIPLISRDLTVCMYCHHQVLLDTLTLCFPHLLLPLFVPFTVADLSCSVCKMTTMLLFVNLKWFRFSPAEAVNLAVSCAVIVNIRFMIF